MGREVRTVLPGTKRHAMNICRMNTFMPLTYERLDTFLFVFSAKKGQNFLLKFVPGLP